MVGALLKVPWPLIIKIMDHTLILKYKIGLLTTIAVLSSLLTLQYFLNYELSYILIFYNLFFSVSIGLISTSFIKMLSLEQRLENKKKLEQIIDVNSIISDGPASYYSNNYSFKGHLILTNDKLFFSNQSKDDENDLIEILIKNIKQVRISKSWNYIDEGVIIETKMDSLTFLIEYPMTWKTKLDKIIKNNTSSN